MQFDVIPFEDIKGEWKKLGSGSFGNVYKGSYLGIDVAIKEVLPSNDYDVRKYFEREWKLMREARHPNVVLFLGLSHAPAPDGRVFIISEFIENGNLRQYIFAKSKPFPWRLRLSFATDIARALAYLHARNCVHRDIKGENLLLTSNGRLKITDFGFARITPRNADEAKRLTFCGTDAYMSPEILMGEPFDLPTDVFSLGVIFCEILARRVADEHAFKRAAPTFALDPAEVASLASPNCPPALIALALDCCSPLPSDRPSMLDVLSRLAAIESALPPDEDAPVGTARFFTAEGGRRPRAAPRIPSFGLGVGVGIGTGFQVEVPGSGGSPVVSGGEEDGEEEGSGEDEVEGEEEADVGGATVKRTPSWAQYSPGRSSFMDGDWAVAGTIPSEADADSRTRLLTDRDLDGPGYSTTVVKHSQAPTIASELDAEAHERAATNTSTITVRAAAQTLRAAPTASDLSAASYHTAPSPSIALATEGGTLTSLPPSSLSASASSQIPVHRFTLIKISSTGKRERAVSSSSEWSGPLFGFFFSNALGAKCDLCGKRLGWKAALECDDCGLRCHVKCGEKAPRDCGLRFPKVMPAVPASAPLPRKRVVGGKVNGLSQHR